MILPYLDCFLSYRWTPTYSLRRHAYIRTALNVYTHEVTEDLKEVNSS